MNSIFIKNSFRRIDLVHRQELERVHHIRRIPEIRPHCLPSFKSFETTVSVHVARGIGIDVFGPDFPLDEQNGGVVDAALV